MRHYSRIISIILAFATVISLCVLPVSAIDYSSKTGNYWDAWLATNIRNSQISMFPSWFNNMVNSACAGLSANVCEYSVDGYHHCTSIDSYQVDSEGYILNCTCDDCHKKYDVQTSDLPAAYDQHVEDMPVNGITNTGSFVWYPTCANFSSVRVAFDNVLSYESDITSLPSTYRQSCYRGIQYYLSDNGDGVGFDAYPPVGDDYVVNGTRFYFRLSLSVPCSGTYVPIQDTRSLDFSAVGTDGLQYDFQTTYDRFDLVGKNGYWTAGTIQTFEDNIKGYSKISVAHGKIYFPVFSVTPDVSALVGHENDYTVDTRPAAYIKYFDERIIDESTNTFYMPETNETYDMREWSYDYSDRSYHVTTNEGDQYTVTYGDENITIKHGDTVNTYNYYITNNNGETCQHEYVLSNENPPTCTSFGSRLYTCSKCNDTYSEVVPALGHDWQFVESVPAVVDDGGNETKAAYDLYRCSRCGEEKRVGVGESPSNETPELPADAGMWSALFKWLEDFKSWLGGQLGGGDTNIEFNQDGDTNDITVTVEDENGDKQEVSFDSIKAKFKWWRDVADIGNMFLEEVSASEQQAYAYNAAMLRAGAPTGAPSIKIDLGAAQSNYGYQYGGEVEMLDLSWYTPYKRTVDDLISGFLWLLFLWNLFKRAPSIISGGDMIASKSEDLSNGFKPKKRG